jgi:membrane associated rhomboid family serine protease
MQTGGGYSAGHNFWPTKAGTPAALALAGFFLIAALVQWWGVDGPSCDGAGTGAGAPGGGGTHWTELCALRWERVRDWGDWWRLLAYCAVHHSFWHAVAGAVGLYVAGRAVEPIIGSGQMLGAALLGAVAGAFTSWGLGAFIALAQPSGDTATGPVAGEVCPDGPPLEGTLPMLAALVGVYSTILPGWRMGAACRWRVLCPLTAGAFGWLVAVGCALWWASGWFPEAGPAPMLAGLLAGWGFARLLGFGEPLFGRHKAQDCMPGFRRVEEMNWEEFLSTELNPVLEKISTQGIQSLTRAEWRILQQSRRKLEGW